MTIQIHQLDASAPSGGGFEHENMSGGDQVPSTQVKVSVLGVYPLAQAVVQVEPYSTLGPSTQDGLAAFKIPRGAAHVSGNTIPPLHVYVGGVKAPALQVKAETLALYPLAQAGVQIMSCAILGPSLQDNFAAFAMPVGASHGLPQHVNALALSSLYAACTLVAPLDTSWLYHGFKIPALQLKDGVLATTFQPLAQAGVHLLPCLTSEPSLQDGLAAFGMPLGAGHGSPKHVKVYGTKLPALQLKDFTFGV